MTRPLDDDLNTSLAITALYDVLKAKTNDATKLAALADFDRVLSLDLLAACGRDAAASSGRGRHQAGARPGDRRSGAGSARRPKRPKTGQRRTESGTS